MTDKKRFAIQTEATDLNRLISITFELNAFANVSRFVDDKLIGEIMQKTYEWHDALKNRLSKLSEPR